MKTLLLSIITLFIATIGFSQTELWGMTAEGGEFSSGVIFKTDVDGTNQSVEHSFFTNVGITTIYVKLCEASNGKFYGTARMDGSGSAGVLFEYDPVTEVYTKKIDFQGASNGKNPEGGLYEASNGLLYGMTSRGGANDLGVLYSYDPSTNTLIKLFDFDGTTNGSLPYGTLIEAPNGRLYGLTSRGGSNNAGILFEYNPVTSIFVKKVTFTGANGSRPYGTLMEASDNKFYGTTNLGGANSLGIIFSYTAGATSVTNEIDFNGAVRGSGPVGNLVEAPNGRLYGTASAGGANGDGTLFEFWLSNGTFIKKVDFNSAVSGDTPNGSLIYASNGLFYGMTRTGGANNDGVLYSYDYVSNTYTHRFDFDAGPTGDRPSGTLLESGGLFYGLTYTGGSMGGGTLFEFNPTTDVFTKKVDLAASPDGSDPFGSLMQHSNNKLYGLSRIGGDANDGVIFEYDHATSTYTNLHEFGLGLDGQNPRGELIEATNGKLYGLADRGGTSGVGVLFEYDVATDIYTKLLDFDGTNGAFPKGSLLEASNGKLYGMTREGGVNDEGVLFEYVIATNTLTLKLEFDLFVSGRWPSGSLIEASNGLLYGLTENGGTNYRGVIFEFDTSTDTYTKRYDFNTEHQPFGQLVEAANGNLYGLTLTGGANGGGALFEYVIASATYTNKYDFDGFPFTNGANSYGSLIEASNGHLYGMTKLGGIYNDGVIFEWNLATDTYTMKTEFNYANGANPEYGRLLEVSIPCTPTTSTDIQSACDTYTWIDGGVYTMSNNSAQWIIPNAAGCDSIITLDLTITNSTASTDVRVACDTYTWINGLTYTSDENTATWTIPNAAGCDSVVTLDLTINNSNTGTDVQVACDTYTWVNGITYTSSITGPTWMETNIVGCDSVVTLDLTINNSSTGTDVVTACGSAAFEIPNNFIDDNWNGDTDEYLGYQWIDNNYYTATNNLATYTLTNADLCDSVVTLDLIVLPPYTVAYDVVSACDTYTWVNGTTYNSSVTPTGVADEAYYYYAINGCDSVMLILDLTINNSTSSTDVQTACDSYTWIDGNPYTSSNNTATHTVMNAAGCDSIITLDLTITNSTSSTDVITACDTYTWIDGNPYTSSNNTATHTVMNAAGCDSIITLDLTITNSTSSTDVITACDTYTWIDGNPYSSSNNTATHTVMNAAGCDSVITLDLTINQPTSSTDVITACDTYTWIDGNPYTSSNNTATHTVMNAAGCDSIVTLDLTLNYSTSSTDVQSACGSYTWIDGNVYTSTNNSATYADVNAVGCDSIITLDLTITPLPNTNVTQSGVMLTADQSGATYQWLDCDNNQAFIVGATNQSYTPATTGNYSVEVIFNGCTDTSSCFLVDYTGLDEVDAHLVTIYPNPVMDNITIQGLEIISGIKDIQIVSPTGQLVKQYTGVQEIINVSELSNGVYFLNIRHTEGVQSIRFVKQ